MSTSYNIFERVRSKYKKPLSIIYTKKDFNKSRCLWKIQNYMNLMDIPHDGDYLMDTQIGTFAVIYQKQPIVIGSSDLMKKGTFVYNGINEILFAEKLCAINVITLFMEDKIHALKNDNILFEDVWLHELLESNQFVI